MILDKIQNIETYKGVSSDIYRGLQFIASADKDIKLGEYTISEKVKAFVTEYETVEHFERGYEAHKHEIDIQYPIRGYERIKWSPIDEMVVNIPYDKEKDRTFYKSPSDQMTEVVIGNDYFAIFFPQDGHGPQHYFKEKELIKKITVKVYI